MFAVCVHQYVYTHLNDKSGYILMCIALTDSLTQPLTDSLTH